MIIKIFAIVGLAAIIFGVAIFIVNLCELFERVDTLEWQFDVIEDEIENKEES